MPIYFTLSIYRALLSGGVRAEHSKPYSKRDALLYCDVPAQPVAATPSNALIWQCFLGRTHLFGSTRSKPSQGSVPADLTWPAILALVFNARWVRAECCVDRLRPPRLPGPWRDKSAKRTTRECVSRIIFQIPRFIRCEQRYRIHAFPLGLLATARGGRTWRGVMKSQKMRLLMKLIVPVVAVLSSF